MPDEVSYNEFLSAFGVADPATGTEPSKVEEPDKSVGTEVTPPEQKPSEGEGHGTGTETDPKPTETDPKPTGTEPTPTPDKSAAAFAQMRTENKQYQSMIKNVAGILGVQDTKDPNTVMTTLQELVTKAQAQKQGVPPELLTRLQQLEQSDQEYRSNQIRQAAYLGFQKVKDTFNISETELGSFADELIHGGVNPFEQVIDLVNEYKVRNFDKLVAAAEAKGAQAEAERAAKAMNQGTTPSKTQGANQGSGADAEKITSVSQLNDWFAQQK